MHIDGPRDPDGKGVEAVIDDNDNADTPDARSRWRLLIRHRFGFQAGLDAISWAIAIGLATLLRYDFAFEQIQWERLLL